jgi:2-(1,2-epoxy-1,2-dihydrophenyl)acetyl-CoA isomerase
MPDVLLHRDDTEAIATITLNRPSSLNSFDSSMLSALIEAIDHAKQMDGVRCLILTGAGRAFSTGQDLNERKALLEGEKIDLGNALESGFNSIARAIRTISQPVICAVNGPAVGAGANLALACDIVVAAKSASFTQSFVKIGLIPDTGGTWVLPRLVGHARATALAMLADPISASEAERIGMIWKCCEDDELGSASLDIAEQLVNQSPKALSLLKSALNASAGNSLSAQLNLERDLQREAGYTDDYRKGVARFLNKRDRRTK